MTIAEYLKWALGKSIDFDGTAGVQCVDLIKSYLSKVWSITPGSWGDARYYYDSFDRTSWGGYKPLNKYFTRIPNDANFIPMKGDIVIWGKDFSSKHNCGHIGIATGEGDKKYFTAYNQNYSGKHDACAINKFFYNWDFKGVLRPKRTLKANVNIRKGPGVTYGKVNEGGLTAGTMVTVYETKGSWVRIGDGKWISGKYFKSL